MFVPVALVLIAAEAQPAKADVQQVCAHGTRTTLETRTRYVPDGKRVRDQALIMVGDDGKTLWSKLLSGAQWLCLGFDVQRQRYLIARHETWRGHHVVRDLAYLAEVGGEGEIVSAFGNDRDRGFDAFAVLSSPLGRHVAFVGGRGVIDGLYVLDTQTDQVRRLDDPPAPPPHALDGQFGWACCLDGIVTLEPSVMRFATEDVLVVSYGKDSPNTRAKARTVKKFSLWPWPYVPERTQPK